MDAEYPTTMVLLVRHGQARSADGTYDWDTPLNEIGRRQAAAVADEVVLGGPVAAVHSSPWPRALETSAPLCARLGLEAVVDSRLTEFDLGAGTIGSVLQRPDLLVWRAEQRGYERGETLREFFARVADFCEEMVERWLGNRLVVVTHSGTIEAVIRWALGLSPEHPWQSEFDLVNGSITEMTLWPRGRLDGGSPRYIAFKRIGDARHLAHLVTDI